jgi:predicted membrane-bound spermidine synthase
MWVRGWQQNRLRGLSVAGGKAIHMSRVQINACIIAFIASFSAMVVEIVAGRILAPSVGVSLYTWTSIIGVVLAGIAAGAYLGGLIADRYARPSTLAWILVLSGLAVLCIPLLTGWSGGIFFTNSLMARVLLATIVVFFVPSCLLGAALPVVVKLTLASLEKTGNVVGKIYAFSTLGSILGTYASGFFLISWIGTRNLLFAIALLLFVSSLFGGFLARKKLAFVLLFLPLLWPLHHHLFSPVLDPETLVLKESNYYTIKLKRGSGGGGGQLITLYLDQLTHSCSDPDNPARLQFRYTQSFKEIVEWKAGEKKSLRTLFIGGGGYTFPRFIEARYPNAEIDVVEIDPMVTWVSRKYMGVSPTTKIRTFNEDARWFMMNRKGEGVYDFIFEDAFNDLSIPYHLTTREFALELRRLLRNDGLLLTNVIDRFEKGSFLPSYVRTLEEVFGRGNVHLVTLGPVQGSKGIENRVVLASPRGLDVEALAESLDGIEEIERVSYIMSQHDLQDRLDKSRPVVLTDDYAPVDNLTAANFR